MASLLLSIEHHAGIMFYFSDGDLVGGADGEVGERGEPKLKYRAPHFGYQR